MREVAKGEHAVTSAIRIFVTLRAARWMNSEIGLQQKCKELAGLFEKSNIPNTGRLVGKLRGEPEEEDFLSAMAAWALHKDGTYAITDLKAGDGTRGVTVQLNRGISVQSSTGFSTFGPIGDQVVKKGLGHTEWDRDRDAVFERLGSLPSGEIGVLLAWSKWMIISGLPEWYKDMSAGKCVLNVDRSKMMYHTRQLWPWTAPSAPDTWNETVLYHAPGFQGAKHPRRIASLLGCPVVACNP